ncbi:MAG TPA: lactate utilization protein [Beijerinckiaceae bacterium]|nr:lactate utilization protein [Beijerinckiaceae bacterium]
MTARADILANIRRSLGVAASERMRVQAVEDRIERSPRGVIPARGQVDPVARRDLFKAQAEGVQATVEVVANAKDVPEAVARYLRERNLPATARIGADPVLVAMPWEDTAIEVAHGKSEGRDLNAVSRAVAGVAETGTLVLHSGGDNPTTLNFLPDNHIVVLKAGEIVGDYESVWSKLRMTFGKGELPRTVNFITGPSRSADIEQKLQLGAHGPRNLHIVIVEK